MPGDAVPGDVVPGDAVLGAAVPGDVVPGDAVPRDAVPRGAASRDAVPGDAVSSNLGGDPAAAFAADRVPDGAFGDTDARAFFGDFGGVFAAAPVSVFAGFLAIA